jgi:hypothetical protein
MEKFNWFFFETQHNKKKTNFNLKKHMLNSKHLREYRTRVIL